MLEIYLLHWKVYYIVDNRIYVVVFDCADIGVGRLYLVGALS